MQPRQKAADVLARLVTPQPLSTTASDFCSALNQFSGNLTGDPYRDVDRVASELHPNAAVFLGMHGSTCRMYGALQFDTSQEASITLLVTKGSLDALDPGLFGQSGPDIGNRLLVARMLDIAISTLRERGVRYLVNEPFDERVARIYRRMGFVDRSENSQLLDLNDSVSLERAFEFVAQAYEEHGLALTSPP